MLTVTDTAELRSEVAAWKRQGFRVGFVPTMGALHAGHLSLVAIARGAADRVVASVFVNPKQFDRPEDLAAYPRSPRCDAELLAAAGCHLLFLPPIEAVYPPGHVTRVEVAGPPAEGLEAEHRPGHFRGVATVVTLLVNLVEPQVAVFGEKDAQQLALVRRLARDLALPVEILGGPTVREPDGLALSSRNVRLSPDERRAATVLYRALSAAREAIDSGERRAETARRRLREVLAGEPMAHVEYAEAVDAESFWPLDVLRGRVVLPVAARFGATRLIDNFHLQLEAS